MTTFHTFLKKAQTAAIVLPVIVAGGFLLSGCGGGGDAPTTTSSTGGPSPTIPANKTPISSKANVPDGWKTLTSQAGNYEIMMPEKTDNSTVDVPSKLGTLKTHMVTASPSNETAFIASHVDYPSAVDKANKEKMLDDARGGMAKGKKIISEKQIEMDGFPGREFVLTSNEKGQNIRMDVRVFLVKRRLYQILAVSTEGKRPKDADAFLDSFKFLKAVEKN